jgi:hypothetical protein
MVRRLRLNSGCPVFENSTARGSFRGFGFGSDQQSSSLNPSTSSRVG